METTRDYIVSIGIIWGFWGVYWDNMGIMENQMWGYIGMMEKKMEATIVYWGKTGIMENKMETTGIIGILQGYTPLRCVRFNPLLKNCQVIQSKVLHTNS